MLPVSSRIPASRDGRRPSNEAIGPDAGGVAVQHMLSGSSLPRPAMSRRRRGPGRRRRQTAASGRRGRRPKGEPGLRFTRKTALYGAAGAIFAAAGFLLLARGSINLAPVLLLIGFLGFFPLALVR